MTDPKDSSPDESGGHDRGDEGGGDERHQYLELLDRLFWAAYEANPFGTLCTVLRVGGMQDAGWDPFEEASDAFHDFNWMLAQTLEVRGERAARRVSLLMYCQAVEMSAPHEILANLLRCVGGQDYAMGPFQDLGRRSKKKLFFYVPPSAKQKFARIAELATAAGWDELAEVADRIFHDGVRNAFSHSDYILTDEYFRFHDGGLATQMDVAELDELVGEALAFYGAFFALGRRWLENLGRLPRYHQWPGYEVLEILTTSDGVLHGFRVHFSNGHKSTYSRQKSGTQAINLRFREEGVVFLVGSLDDLTNVWKIDGKPVEDWSKLEGGGTTLEP